MARKRARLTRKKKSGEAMERQAPNGITPRKFAKLAHEYGSFILENQDHDQISYHIGDTAYIQYQDLEDNVVVPEDDYWVGKIQDIRGDDPDEVWVRVQWFWSPQEVAEVIKSFDPTICGKYEKLSSDSSDIISVHCFVRHVEVKMFDEKSIYQIAIGQDEWFSRYEFRYNARRISPKVTHTACAICRVPYTPGSGVEKIHHFCPRPSCLNFYHQSCLVKHGYVEATRTCRVLETWPDIDRTTPAEELLHYKRPPGKRPEVGHEEDPLQGFPPQLVAVAGQQIIRGTREGGVVGNIAPVAAARQLIFKALSRSEVVPTDWETSIDISLALLESKTLPNCICPRCFSPI